ncbi:hypothetical protein R6Q57_018611 [Mikania cordata]
MASKNFAKPSNLLNLDNDIGTGTKPPRLVKKEKIGLDFTALTPPFNHNYSIMPNINTFVDDLPIKSDRRCDFTTSSNIPIPLTTDPVETDPNISDDSEVCGDSLNDTGLRGKNEERSARKST